MPTTALDRLRNHWQTNGLAWKDGARDTASAQAPGHSPADRSVTFRQITGQVLMNSHADDKTVVLDALGLTMRDLFDDANGTTYRYRDGRTVHRAYKDNGRKDFRQTGNTKGRDLYRVERLDQHLAGTPVYVVEGEKDVHAIESVGGVAVCNAMGAGKAHLFDWSPLAGHAVVIVADADTPGKKHAQQIAGILDGVAAGTVIVEAKTGKDAADHVLAGHGLDEFEIVTLASDSGQEQPTFWEQRPVLTHVLEFSRARRAGPWAVLGVVLARIIAALEPNIMLPPKPGAAVSLNLFVALVGPSGGGKGVAMGTARDAVRVVDFNGRPVDVEEFPLGSGEGVSRTYRPAGTDEEESNPRTRALFDAPEVDTLAALGARQGSTLMPELRKLFMGEQLGFNNGSKATRSILAAHSYRAGLTIGVQPAKAGPLLYDADGGTPQRFVWMPVHDPDAPDIAPATPQQWTVKLPRFGTDTVHLEVPAEARQMMDTHRLATLRGEAADPLDGHRMLTRLKVAAALMVLDGRSVVDVDDWALAGTVMAVSDRTRTGIERTLADRAREVNRARAQADGERAAIVDDHKHDGEVRRAREGAIRYLERRGRAAFRELAKSLKSDVRPHLDMVLADLVESRSVREIVVDDRRFYELGNTT